MNVYHFNWNFRFLKYKYLTLWQKTVQDIKGQYNFWNGSYGYQCYCSHLTTRKNDKKDTVVVSANGP